MSKPWWSVEGEGGHMLVADPFDVWVSATQNVRGNYDWAVRLEDAFACRTAVAQGEAGTHDDAVWMALLAADAALAPMARAARTASGSIENSKPGASVKPTSPEWADLKCTCRRCNPPPPFGGWMILCATCGNKRCPHATDCRNACTGSNEPGQAGSIYPAWREGEE